MKIDTQLNLVGITSERQTDSSRVRPAVVAPQADENTSELSAPVRTLAAGFEQSPEVRSSRVEPLRQAVASGQYQVDAQAVATSMMRELM